MSRGVPYITDELLSTILYRNSEIFGEFIAALNIKCDSEWEITAYFVCLIKGSSIFYCARQYPVEQNLKKTIVNNFLSFLFFCCYVRRKIGLPDLLKT